MLRTAVVGAGPAGLLFSLIGKVLMGEGWELQLFDKRETYARTHRLRIDPRPYLKIQTELHHPRFDSLISFLQEQHFSPEVNLLEAAGKRVFLVGDAGVSLPFFRGMACLAACAHALARTWEVQMALLAVVGTTLALLGRVSGFALIGWWILGAAFVVGLYLFEWLVARRLRQAQLEEPPAPRRV